MRTVPPTEKGKYKTIASGAIANGKPVVVNSAGTVSQVAEVTASLGSSSTTIPASSSTGIGYAGGTFDSSNGKVVVIFQDQGDGNKAKARVGTVDTSDNSISFGTIATANDAATNYPVATFDSNSNKVVVLYADDGNSGHGTGVVGTVSGTDISFGSETVFESANTYYASATFDSSNNKVVVAYNDGGNSGYGTAVVGTVSGTSISFGTPVVFESANAGFESIVFDSSNNKVVIAYRDDGNSYYGTAIVGTVSGTSISFGSAAVYHSTNAIANMIAFDSTNNKVVIAYKDNSDSSKGKAVVGTVSGTSISFGSPAVFEAGAIVTSGNTGIGIVYDSNAEKIVIHYEDSGDSNYSKLIVGTVSGTSISFAGELTTYAGNTVYQNAIFDSTNNRVVTVLNNFAKVYNNAEPTNLTTENYIGIATGGSYADGQSVTVDVIGTVNDDQSSLTAGQQYFVQEDGTLGLTADSTSVVAGIAISATELIVKE